MGAHGSWLKDDGCGDDDIRDRALGEWMLAINLSTSPYCASPRLLKRYLQVLTPAKLQFLGARKERVARAAFRKMAFSVIARCDGAMEVRGY
jgi:hypothetical protein